MTKPTSFDLSPVISKTDTLVFDDGLETGDFLNLPNQVGLLGYATSGVFLTFTMLYFVQGTYNDTTKTFTIDDGTEKLYWVGFPLDFSTVGLNGGDWKLGT